MDSRLAGAVVFVASGAVLVLEILAGRLLAPYVGVSLETFTGIIGVVLAGIAIGTWLGGWLADRIDPRRLLPGALALGGAAAIAAVPIIRALGPSARPPTPPAIVVLAAVGFFAALGAAQRGHPARRQGPARRARPDRPRRRPAVGARHGRLARRRVRHRLRPRRRVPDDAGRDRPRLAARRRRRRAVVAPRPAPARRVVVAGCARRRAWRRASPSPPRPPCDVETAYYCAAVRADPRAADRARRSCSTTSATPTSTSPTRPTSSSPTPSSSATSSTPSRPAGEPIDAVHLGGGGFTIPRYLAATRPGSTASCSSSTPASSTSPRTSSGSRLGDDLRVVTGDARVNLADVADDSADLVVGDAFGGRAVPWHLTTTEFVADIRRVLRDDGVYAQNIIDQPPLGFLRAEVATMRDVFEHVAVIGPAGRFDRQRGRQHDRRGQRPAAPPRRRSPGQRRPGRRRRRRRRPGRARRLHRRRRRCSPTSAPRSTS